KARVSAYFVNEYRARSSGTMNRLVAQSPTFMPTSAISHAMNTWAIAPKRLLRILPAQIRVRGAPVRRLTAKTAKDMFTRMKAEPATRIKTTVPTGSSEVLSCLINAIASYASTAVWTYENLL